ncbi:VOC family protein [Phycicoccus flavus]|uniref:VOC family protein n=1 Tax=Phycicoccus flavus TaxID=2502783 RepID=UPI000FEC05C7|nr:VOC family protein [Phycicoccus flavus]NHA69068.1 glyoxalase [Phycicoccus flavus]
MRVVRVTVDLTVPDLDEAAGFYTGFLGLEDEDLGLDWVARFVAPGSGDHVQLMTTDASAPENPQVTLKVDDVDAFHAEAVRRGYEIVHPLTDEPWGIRRFLVRAPDGTVVNIARHRE